MAKNGVFVSDRNNPNAGYDIYVNGKLIGWARTPGAAQNIFNKATMATTPSGQGSGGNPQQQASGDEEAKGQGRIPQFIIKSVITNSSFWKKFIIILLIIIGIIAFDIYGWGLS